MQRQALALMLALTLALAGCGDKDKLSQDEMAKRVDAAVANLEADLGPGGAISGAVLSVPVDAGFATISVPLTLKIGPAGDMRIDGSFGNPLGGSKVTVQAYCSNERLIVISNGLEDFSDEAEDVSIEARNIAGTCLRLEGAAAELLGGFGGVGELLEDDGRLERTKLSQPEKGTIEAVYLDQQTDATLTLSVVGKRVERVGAATDGQELTVAFNYGPRQEIAVPKADHMVPIGVEWSLQKGSQNGDPGTVNIIAGEMPIEEHQIRVYGKQVPIPCSGGPATEMTFDMANGLRQTRDGFDIDYRDDGDGIMDKGDKIFLWGPDRLESPWQYKVEVWDKWSDASADPVCSIPGPELPLVVASVVGLALIVRRRLAS